MNKKHLESTVYKEFVRDHILRPYQTTLVGNTEKSLDFTQTLYDSIPKLVDTYPEWTEMVFGRISEIFEIIDTGVFPSDLPAMVILTECAKRGVEIDYT